MLLQAGLPGFLMTSRFEQMECARSFCIVVNCIPLTVGILVKKVKQEMRMALL